MAWLLNGTSLTDMLCMFLFSPYLCSCTMYKFLACNFLWIHIHKHLSMAQKCMYVLYQHQCQPLWKWRVPQMIRHIVCNLLYIYGGHSMNYRKLQPLCYNCTLQASDVMVVNDRRTQAICCAGWSNFTYTTLHCTKFVVTCYYHLLHKAKLM